MPTIAGAATYANTHPEHAGERRHQAALNQELLCQPQAPGANRETQRHLTVARCGTRGQQVRDVGARDQHDEPHNGGENPQRTLKSGSDLGWPVGGGGDDERRFDVLPHLVSRRRRRKLACALAPEDREGRLQHGASGGGIGSGGQPARGSAATASRRWTAPRRGRSSSASTHPCGYRA